MYNDIFVSYFIPTVNSNPRCDTSCLGPAAPICNSVSGSLRRTGGETLGPPENRQEQVEHDRVGCRSRGVRLPRGEEGTRGLPGENVCGGIRSPADLVPLHTRRPCCVTTGRGGGGAICGGFTVLPNLPKPLHVIRDKDRGLSYSTSILRASQKTGHPEPPEEPLTAAAAAATPAT